MQRYERAVTREMVASAAMAFAAMSAILVVVLLVRVLGKAALGDIAGEAVLPMLGFGFLRFLPVLLSLSLFIGVFVSLTRLWRDSEAVIWMNGGVGPLGWIRPVLRFCLPVVLIIALVSLEGVPWGLRMQAEYEQILQAREQVTTLTPGVFVEDRQGRRVVFVERLDSDRKQVGNVFIYSQDRGRMGVTVARQGNVQSMDNGDSFLVLEQGKRYEGVPGEADFWMVAYERYGLRIPPQEVIERGTLPRMMGVAQLWQNPVPRHMGEWVSRLGYPLIALILCVLAIPLSYVNPRAGRSLNVVFAILIYAAYANVVGLSQGWVSRSVISAGQSLVLVHGAVLLLVAAFFWYRFKGPWAK